MSTRRENMKYLEFTNAQLYDEMRKFQEEISSDQDDEEEEVEGAGGRREAREGQGLIEKLRKKREKEKQRRLEKLKAHQEEVEKYQERVADLQTEAASLSENIQERENKYELLAEEFTAVQKNFSAYKASREEMEDPFVLRLALNVTRRQLWDLQAKMNDIGEDGASIILSQQHQQEMEEKQKTVESLELYIMKLDDSVVKMTESEEQYEVRLAELEAELAEMRDSATPRPDWRRCGPVVEASLLHSHWSRSNQPRLSLVQIQPASALIGRRLQSVATPDSLCHKEPARTSKAHQRLFVCSSLALYGIGR